MSSKLGLILSFYLIMLTFLLGTDLVIIQSIFTNLDAISQNVAYKIANYGINDKGDLDNSLCNYVYEELGAELIRGETGERLYLDGDIYPFILSKEYKGIILGQPTIRISIKRYAVIGINHT